MVTTQNQVRVEDLSRASETLDQRATPFWQALKTGKRLENHLLYGQAVDKMGKRRKPGVPERQDVKGYEGDDSKKLYQRGARFQRTPAVSTEAQELNNRMGASNEKAYNEQVTKKIKENKRDIDYYCLGDDEARDDDGKDGYRFRALGRHINDGTKGAATSTAMDGATMGFTDQQTTIPAEFRTPSAQIYTGTLAAFEEATFKAMLQSRYNRTGVSAKFVLWAASGLKSHIDDNFGKYVADKAGYSPVVSNNVTTQQGKVMASTVDVWQGPYGTITVELEPWMPTTTRGYGIDMEDVEKRLLYLARHTEHPDLGGGKRGLIDSIVSGWWGDPRRSVKIAPSDEVAAVVDFES